MDAAHLLDVGGAAEPSFFELASQRSMANVLAPALRYLATVVTSWRPRLLGPLLGYVDEVILLIEYLLQRRYLRDHAATLAENFYGLKRVPVGSVPGAPRALTPGQRGISLFFAVLGPYLAKKAEAHRAAIERRARDPQAGRQSQWRAVIEPVLLKVYPFAQTTWNLGVFATHILCLTGRLNAFTPDLWLAGLQLARLDRGDYEAQTTARELELASRQAGRLAAGPTRAAALLLWHGVRDAARFALPIGIFFLSFMQWWHASGHAAAANATPVVPAPIPPSPSPDGVQLVADPRVCPLCRDHRTNPAVVAGSGLVFCYPCGFKYLERHGRCPVTHLPATTDMLIRIHD